MELKTPLYDEHEKLGGKIVSYAGFLLPVQYKTGIIAEHNAVRKSVGIFDVSHMGEILVEGKDALANLNYILTNEFSKMANGRVAYSIMCYENGGTVDDLLVYKYNNEKFMLVVNAANKDKDFAWILQHKFGDVSITDISSSMGLIALQGPNALFTLQEIATAESIPEKYYSFIGDAKIDWDIPCLISKTGYTGENGYEIYAPNEYIVKIWNLILDAGKQYNITPCGLGARDTLRLEASMPLYGHELSENISPSDCGLNFAIKLNKENFIGKDALATETKVALVGFELVGRGIARGQEQIYYNDEIIGHTTSGTHLPYLGKAVCLAYINKDLKDSTEIFYIDVRGKKIEAKIIKLPFYKKA